MQIFSAVVEMLVHKMADKEVEFLVLCHLVARRLNMWGSILFLISLYTLFTCVKLIVLSCGYAGLSGRYFGTIIRVIC